MWSGQIKEILSFVILSLSTRFKWRLNPVEQATHLKASVDKLLSRFHHPILCIRTLSVDPLIHKHKHFGWSLHPYILNGWPNWVKLMQSIAVMTNSNYFAHVHSLLVAKVSEFCINTLYGKNRTARANNLKSNVRSDFNQASIKINTNKQHILLWLCQLWRTNRNGSSSLVFFAFGDD